MNTHISNALRLAMLILAGAGGSVVAIARPLEDSVAAYKRGDFATALRLLRPLAEQGDAPAQFNLGFMYAEGHGVARDYREAVKWYLLAAEQGNGPAQANLGVMYDTGQGVVQDYREALKWYRLGAEHGQTRAQLKLGVMYFEGHGVIQNYLRAHMWYNIAASKADGDESQQAADNRDLVAKSLTAAQLVKAQEMAQECEARSFKNCE